MLDKAHNIRQTPVGGSAVSRLGSEIRRAKTAITVRDKVRAAGAERIIGEVGPRTKETSRFSKKRTIEESSSTDSGRKTAQFHKKSRTDRGSNK